MQPHLLKFKMIFPQIFHDNVGDCVKFWRGCENFLPPLCICMHTYRKLSDITHISQGSKTAPTCCFGAQNSYIDTCRITQNHFLFCKQTHCLTLSMLSCVWGIVHVLLSPQVFLPDLRDDVISFFECEGKNIKQAIKSLDIRYQTKHKEKQLRSLVFGMYLENRSRYHLKHLSYLFVLLCHVLWFNEQLLQQSWPTSSLCKCSFTKFTMKCITVLGTLQMFESLR